MKSLTKYLFPIAIVFMVSCAEDDAGFSFGENDVSQSGSLAKFLVKDEALYVIEDMSLSVFDISDTDLLNRKNKLLISRTVETVFNLGDILYLGTSTGVLFYDISEPWSPKVISAFDHLTSCDPVISDGIYAYSTLRSGTNCRMGSNTLDIIDIQDLENPILKQSYNMKSPYGLGLKDHNLFIGEKENGMLWLDVSDIDNVSEIGRYEDIKAIDFIIKGDIILVRATDAIYQFEILAGNQLSQLSRIDYDL